MGNAGWIHLGEAQPWMPLAGLEYGFPIGIIIGFIVVVKRSHDSRRVAGNSRS
jgi:hypothetical protein